MSCVTFLVVVRLHGDRLDGSDLREEQTLRFKQLNPFDRVGNLLLFRDDPLELFRQYRHRQFCAELLADGGKLGNQVFNLGGGVARQRDDQATRRWVIE